MTDRPFVQTLCDLRRGTLTDQLQGHLTRVVAAVRETGCKGSLTLTLTIKPAKGDSAAVLIDDDVKCKIPTHPHEPSIMFVTEENELTRRDPRQPKLDLDGPTPGPRPVDFRSRAAGEDPVASDEEVVAATTGESDKKLH